MMKTKKFSSAALSCYLAVLCRFASFCFQSYTSLRVKALLDKMGVTSSSLKSSWTKAVKFAALPYHWVMAAWINSPRSGLLQTQPLIHCTKKHCRWNETHGPDRSNVYKTCTTTMNLSTYTSWIKWNKVGFNPKKWDTMIKNEEMWWELITS